MNKFPNVKLTILFTYLFLIFTYSGFSQNIRSIEIFPNAQKMLTNDAFGNGKLWDLKNETIISEFSSTGFLFVNVSPNLKYFFAINQNGVLQKIKTKDKQIVASQDLQADSISKTFFSKNGKWFYVITQNKFYKISTKDLSFETQDNLGIQDFRGIRNFVFCPTNEIYATVDKYDKKVIYIYEAMTKKEIAQIPIKKDETIELKFSPKGNFLAKQTWTKFVEIYEAKTGKFLFRMDCEKDALQKEGPFRTLSWKDSNGQLKFGVCKKPFDIIFGNNDKFIYEVMMPNDIIYQWDIEKGTITKMHKNEKGTIINNQSEKEDIYLKSFDSEKSIFYGHDRKGRLYKYNLKTKKVSEIGQTILSIQNATYDKAKESIKVYTKNDKGSILKINTKTKSLQQQEHYFPNAKYLTYELTSDDRYALNDYGFTERVLFDSKIGEAYKLPFASHIGGGGFEGKATFSKEEDYFVAQTDKGIYYGNLTNVVKPELHKELNLTHWKFSEDKESIIYLTNAKSQPTLKKLNLKTKGVETLWTSSDKSFQAIYFSYTPDRKKISINTRNIKNNRKTEIIIFDQNFKELYRWNEGGIYFADWLDNSTLISYSVEDFAVLDFETKSTLKLQGKGKHFCTYSKKKQAMFSSSGDSFAAISSKKNNPLFIFDNIKKEFWDLDLPCFQNVNFIEMSKDGKELLIVFQNSIVARLDLKNRKVISQYRFTELNGKIILVEN